MMQQPAINHVQARTRRRWDDVPGIPVPLDERIAAVEKLCAVLSDLETNLHTYLTNSYELRLKIASAGTAAGTLARHYKRVAAGRDPDDETAPVAE